MSASNKPSKENSNKRFIRIRIDSPISKEIKWAWSLFARDINLDWEEPEDQNAAIDLLISENSGADIVLSRQFSDQYTSGTFDSAKVMPDEPLIRNESGHPDYLSSTFYLVNSIQEYGSTAADKYNRFPYEASLQARFNCADENLVCKYFTALYQSVPRLHNAGPLISEPSRFFLSHDVDLLHGAWKEDAKAVLKKGRIDQFISIWGNSRSEKPHWFNSQELMEVNRHFGFPATFFWIPVKTAGNQQPPDADYSISDPRVLSEIELIEQAVDFEVGLHKSINGKLDQETSMLPVAVRSNRTHFLKFRLPEHYEQVAKAGLKIDASLGFAGHYGFRNSYGKPFMPWSAKSRSTLQFLEVPLHMMDATFEHYLKSGPDGVMEACGDFIEKNRDNCVLSLLWHNNYFSRYAYAEYRAVYREMLELVRSLQIRGLNNDELIRLFWQ